MSIQPINFDFYMSNDDRIKSFFGRFICHQITKGYISIDGNFMAVFLIGFRILIPVKSIRTVEVLRFSRITKPLPLNYLKITYFDDQERSFTITPIKSPIESVATSNDRTETIFKSMMNSPIESVATSNDRTETIFKSMICLSERLNLGVKFLGQ